VSTRGVRLGVDVGGVRVGVAVSDPDGILATPLVTLSRDARPDVRRDVSADARPGANTAARATRAAAGDVSKSVTNGDGSVPTDIAELARIVTDREVVEVVVGLPVNLRGRDGPAATQVRAYAARLSQVIDPVPVRLADERMSTVVATRRLSERGIRGKRQRAVVDQAAAVEILQSWLDKQRRRT
jgi:putative Holliday junction resolvase